MKLCALASLFVFAHALMSVQAPEAFPARIIIPSIHVDAQIDPMGLTSGGAMDSPSAPDRAGWYERGSRPGEPGAAVIDGHAGWKDGLPAAFDDLHKIKAGDKIFVEDSAGSIAEFEAREKRIFDKDDDAAEAFISADGSSQLSLITCAGAWDEEEGMSAERLVIFAEKI